MGIPWYDVLIGRTRGTGGEAGGSGWRCGRGRGGAGAAIHAGHAGVGDLQKTSGGGLGTQLVSDDTIDSFSSSSSGPIQNRTVVSYREKE